MNLQRLFDEQRKLDAHINENHPPQPGEDRLSKKILALLVELGECANEWRGFKFWSNNQEPNKLAGRMGRVVDPLLEEFVDCLHFILSIGLEIGADSLLNKDPWTFTTGFKAVERNWLDVYEWTIALKSSKSLTDYWMVFYTFIQLGYKLRFNWDVIEDAYMSKNATNHTRQESNY